MKREISELKNIHKGQDIWVIVSGPSMDFVDPSLFEGKITIGVNDIFIKFKCDYLVRKEKVGMVRAYKTGIKLIMAEYNFGGDKMLNDMEGEYWFFRHMRNRRMIIDFSVVGTDKIIVSWSTVTSAIHVAAYMGAKNIILCGHDCGTLDGKTHFNSYLTTRGWYSISTGIKECLDWFRKIEDQTIQVKRKLKEIYGCNIYSLNPFINLRLEGHKFEG